MKRQDIINRIKEKGYFIIQELVGPEVYAKHGDNAWFVLSTELLETVLFIREKKGKAMTVNTWHRGGKFKERGHRANIQYIVNKKTVNGILYTSGHPLGQGIDFTFEGETAEETREWLIEIQGELPHKIRLEHKYSSTGIPITWVHLDVKYFEFNPKVYLFDI
jgi:hypothetical protein